jgi:hypothetical protein
MRRARAGRRARRAVLGRAQGGDEEAVLRDVLGFRSGEVAAMPNTGEAAVKGALQRAGILPPKGVNRFSTHGKLSDASDSERAPRRPGASLGSRFRLEGGAPTSAREELGWRGAVATVPSRPPLTNQDAAREVP